MTMNVKFILTKVHPFQQIQLWVRTILTYRYGSIVWVEITSKSCTFSFKRSAAPYIHTSGTSLYATDHFYIHRNLFIYMLEFIK